MKKLHAKRLMKLAHFLLTVPDEMFGFATIVKGEKTPRKEMDCGSTACALGWCPVLWPKLVRYERAYGLSSYDVHPRKEDPTAFMSYFNGTANLLFGLTNTEPIGLFVAGHQYEMGLPELTHQATPKQVADNIARYVQRQHPDIEFPFA